jgi:hypothetical protein
MICKQCKAEFEPLYKNGVLLSKICISCLRAKANKQKQQVWRKDKAEMKEKLKTHKDWLKDLQRVFNTYIRLRDTGKPCISCDRQLRDKFDASHYFSVGAYPNVRFHEDNVHGGCVYCNQHLHGNISEYAIRLPLRIGEKRYKELLEARNKPNKLTIDEIKLKIGYYKEKISEIDKKR